jgi:TRAP transporter TAXI family solute receptor
MKRLPVFILAASGLVFAIALVGYLFFSWRPATLRIAVGPPGSEDVKVVQEIAQAFGRERHYVRLAVEVTENATASAAAVGDKKADLAVVRGDLPLPPNAMAAAILRKNLVVLWVTNVAPAGKRPIRKLEDLPGHRIGIIGKTPANLNLLKLILTESGINADKVEIVQFAVSDGADVIRAQKVDAMMAVGPVDSKITADALVATTKPGSSPTFLAISAAEVIARKKPVYESADIAAGALSARPPRPEDEVGTLSFNHLIVARKEIHEATITAFTKQLFAIRHRLSQEFPGVANIQVPDTDKAAAVPAHPGAAAYIDGTERTFLERYSDFMWLGLMALSGIASAGAGVRSYLRRDDRDRNTRLRARMLDMISAARDSRSVDELDAMQREADQILRDTLGCFENGAIDEDTLTAFNIALDQFHNAVADRKMWLVPDAPGRRRAG